MSLKPVKRSRQRRNHRPRLDSGGQWNFSWKPIKRFEPSKHKRVLLLGFVFVVLLFLGGWSQDPSNTAFHSQTPIKCLRDNARDALQCGDPLSFIWDGVMPSGGLGEYNTNRVTALASGSAPCNNAGAPANACISLNPDNNGPAIALTNTTLNDLSTVSNKNLWGSYGWTLSGTPSTNLQMGIYLTSNATKPAIGSDAGYLPENDRSVLLYSKFVYQGANVFRNDLLIKKINGGSDTIGGQNNGGFSGSGSGFLTASDTINNFNTNFENFQWLLNFTGPGEGSCSGGFASIAGGGVGCSSIDFGKAPAVSSTQAVMALPTNVPLYLGFFAQKALGANIVWKADTSASLGATNFLVSYQPVALTVVPTYDSGGFFGPVIKALINIGIFIFNGVLAFIAFIAPALQSALTFLESIMVSAMNFLGNAFGLGNVGTSLATLINQLVTFFSNGSFSSIFTNLPTIFARLIDTLTVYFPWLPNAIAIGLNLASFLVNGVGFALTVFADATLIGIGVAVTILIVLFFVYTGDNSLGGVLEFWETTEWLILGIGLKFLAYLVNFVLDVVTALIGVIPKPFVQMVAHQLPRIPIVDVSARFVQPSGLMSEIKNGNLFAVALWISGLLFTDLFESASPALPGSIGALVPSAAPALVALKGLTALLGLMTVFAWMAAIFVVPIGWFSNAMDLGVNLPFESSLGNRPSSHLGVSIRKGEKHNVKTSLSQIRNVFRRPPKREESKPDENIN